MSTIISLFQSMRVIWAISKGLEITYSYTLIDLKKDLPLPIYIYYPF